MLPFLVLIVLCGLAIGIVSQVRNWATDEPDVKLDSIRTLGAIHDHGLMTDEEWKAVKQVLG